MRSSRIQRALCCATGVSSLALCCAAGGATFAWNKSTGGVWSTAANWTPAGPPTNSDLALFNLNANYTVTLTANQSCGSLTVGSLSAGSVTFALGGHNLQYSGTSHFLAGTVNFIGGSFSTPNIAPILDIDDELNIGTATTVSCNGNLAVGNTASATVSLFSGTLSAGSTFSPASLIGSTLADGAIFFDFGSVGTFAGAIQVGQDNASHHAFLGLFHNSTLSTRSMDIGVTNTGSASVQIGTAATLGNPAVLGGTMTQVGPSTLTIGSAAFTADGFPRASLDIEDGTFITGAGTINVNTGGAVIMGAAGALQSNGDLFISGMVTNAGKFAAGSSTTIHAEAISQVVDPNFDEVESAPCLISSGTFSGGTLVVGTSTSIGSVILAGSSTLGTTIVDGTGDFDDTTLEVPGTLTTGTFIAGQNPGLGGDIIDHFGTLSVSGISIIGGAGTANMSIGTVSPVGFPGAFNTGSLIVGQSPGSSGVVQSASGTITCGTATIGDAGDGRVSVGGVANLSGPIILGNASTGHGTLSITGTLNAASEPITVGLAGAGTLSAGTGAIVNVATLLAGSASSGDGTILQSGSSTSLTAVAVHLGTPLGGAGTYIMSGGTLNSASIEITSNGTFIYNAGQINGPIGINGGALSLPAALPPATVNFSAGTILASNTFNLFATTGTLNNLGNLAGHGIVPAGTTINNSGTFSSSGGDLAISTGAAFANASTGLLRNAPASTLRIQTTSFTNNGNIEVNAGGAVEAADDVVIPSGHALSMKGGLFTNGGNLTIVNGGSLSGFGQIDSNLVNHGSSTFAGSMLVLGNLTNDGTIIARDSTSIVYGSVSNTGSIAVQNGTIVFENALSGATASGGIDGTGSLDVNPDGQLLASYVRQGAMTISGAPLDPAVATIRSRDAGGEVSRVSNLNIASGKLDLDDTALIVDYSGASPVATIQDYLQSGRNGGNWDGLGLTSTHAAVVAADPSNFHKTALGFAEASALHIDSFLDQPVDTTAVLVRYTFAGDANLDGIVNTSDFARLADNFASTARGWSAGDFNYDGVVNALDFSALATNFGQSLPSRALGSVVPEPADLLLSAACLLVRRRHARG